jgi:anti-anti-sigma factor
MEHSCKQIKWEKQGDVFCVRLLHKEFDENGLEELSAEIVQLIDKKGCRKLVMALGPEETFCLYSVFLAKLVNLQRRLASVGGALALAGVNANTQHIFQVAGLDKFFSFYPNLDEAAEALGE